jgi:hypothetical protein
MAAKDDPDLSGFKVDSSLNRLTSGIATAFAKPKTGEGTPNKPDVPQVPIDRLVASPRRQVGKGRRDTILTGADGLP